MAKLQMLKPRVSASSSARVPSIQISNRRITGRKLQGRRLRVWAKDPACAVCGRITDFPGGFELDHKVPLYQGGSDTEDNCQVLCVSYDEQGRKRGCHEAKTRAEARAWPARG